MSTIKLSRARELQAAWAQVVSDVARSCERHGRSRDDVAIIAVTKGFPSSDIRLLIDLGVTDIGESRDHEAARKRAELSDSKVRWHCIGQVQTNKVRSIVQWADVIHSVDRVKLVERMADALPENQMLDVLIQISLDLPKVTTQDSSHAADDDGVRSPINAESARSSRGGVATDDSHALVASVVAARNLNLRGLMTVAPIGADPYAYFTEVAALLHGVRAMVPTATWLSAGMSGDFDAAIASGATHLRIGSAILGSRL